jgi:hypothetical protein
MKPRHHPRKKHLCENIKQKRKKRDTTTQNIPIYIILNKKIILWIQLKIVLNNKTSGCRTLTGYVILL